MIKLIDILKEQEEDLTFNGEMYVRTDKSKLFQASDILGGYFDTDKYKYAPDEVEKGYVFIDHTDLGTSTTSRLGEKGPGKTYVVGEKSGNSWKCYELKKA
jgi:hypothetical protein